MLFTPFSKSMIPQGNVPQMDGISNPLSSHDAIVNSLVNAASGGDDDKKPKYDPVGEAKGLIGRKLKYDNDRPAIEVLKSAAQKAGINPELLFGSSYVEGFNKAIADPDSVSESYKSAFKGGNNPQYPVDGFFNYGLDNFGGNYEKLKKYLPEGFDKRFVTYDAVNEKKQKVKTAAFDNNEDALIAKGAMLRDSMQSVGDYAKKLGVTLDDKANNYFTMAAYNGGLGNAQIMLNEYAKAKDKNAFIDKGQTSRGGVHKNLINRLKLMSASGELLNPKPTK